MSADDLKVGDGNDDPGKRALVAGSSWPGWLSPGLVWLPLHRGPPAPLRSSPGGARAG